MAAQSLGKISATPGSPTQITNNQANPGSHLACNSVIIQTLSSSTGRVYVGMSNMDKTTGVGLLAVLPVPTANSIPSFSIGNPTAPAAFNVADFYIDGDSTSDGVIAGIIR